MNSYIIYFRKKYSKKSIYRQFYIVIIMIIITII